MNNDTERDPRKPKRWPDAQGRKFLSDEDIIGRSGREKREERSSIVRSAGTDKEPKFISDEDIVWPRAA